MSKIEVRTNWIPRDLLCLDELPEKAQADFDYIKGDERYIPHLVKFKGEYYDVYDTQYIKVGSVQTRIGWEMVVPPEHPFAKWDSVISDSYFSGLLFKVTLDDRVVVGQYFS